MTTDASSFGRIAELLVDHYQKTFELTHEFWRERNNLLLLLIGLLAAATLFLSLGQPEANSLLVVWIGKTLGLTDAKITELQNGVNFDLLQVLVLAVVFYLTVNLYHRTQDVIRLYDYLGKVEGDIRKQLALDQDAVAFTRESAFYWKGRPRLLGLVGKVYAVILFLLLGAFILQRLAQDWQASLSLSKIALNIADLILTAAIAIFFVGYARASLKS